MAEQTRKSSSDEVTIAVSPMGDDRGPGTVEHPFRTLERAQNAVRRVNAEHDVRVQLDDGVYRIRRPLKFAAADGGRNGHYVEWAAVTDAHPVISGAISIRKWKLFDKDRDIYVADTPPGLDSRELWVADKLAQVARVEIQRSDVEFTSVGMLLRGAKYDWLGNVTQANRVELRVTGFFTERIAPASSISGRMLTMKQPGWDNNLWGYDTIEKPFHPSLSHLYLANSLAFLNAPGQWYIDPTRGKLYLRPPQKVAPQSLDVELPRLTVLMAVGGSLRNPVENMEFKGIRFSHSTWLGPSSNEGYASQQSGSFLSGHAAAFPADPIATCAQGCKAFESERSHWSQMPAAVQVSAAERITFDGDIFAHLGQYALGIGNDSDATLTRVGLGTGDITVERCVFTDLAGGAILAGGVRQDAHHPRDPRETNRDLIVQNNRIHSIGEEYQDNSAILSTYDEGASILHNDISDVPYDAIDIGYGWGINDAGGNPNYRFRMHGYDWPQNITYQTPTTYRDVVVANNRIHDAKELFHDGGAIYSLSASPGTLITENYIFNNHGRISLYLDEGSRYITVRRNVVDDQGGEWLNVNTVHSIFPIRVSFGNTAISNWHNGSTIGGQWTNYQDNLILDDHMIAGEAWPEEARQIMKNAGIEPSSGQVSYGAAQPDAEESGK
jgi:hypothetical protein